MWNGNYVLFDLDGTLTDSSPGITACVRYALTELGYEVPEYGTQLRFIGPPLLDGFQENIGMTYEQAEVATAKYRERYNVTGLFEAQPYAGIEQVLETLQQQVEKVGLATSKPQEIAERVLEHFGLAPYFDTITGALVHGDRRTKVDVIRAAMEQLEVPEEERQTVLMIGDRKYDMDGAKTCGITSLGVYYGFAEPGELEAHGADYICQTVEELHQFFTQ